MIDQIDSILKREGVIFDSSVVVSNGLILYFSGGLFVAEVNIQSDMFGQPQMSLFRAERKLYK